jgi:glyoxylase-like metal-dependent hydrolase (beta-lactamase superfamily II)
VIAVKTFVVGPFLENTYVVSDSESSEAVIIDPGGEEDALMRHLERSGLRTTAILNTHAHPDHVGGVARLRRELGVPFCLHAGDEFLLDALPDLCAELGIPRMEVPPVDRRLAEGDEHPLGAHRIRTLETPGHSPGSVSFLVGDFLFSGDALFQGSIGRTDFRGGSLEVLLHSIRAKILTLPDTTRVLSGHGPATTVGRERRDNPFLAA